MIQVGSQYYWLDLMQQVIEFLAEIELLIYLVLGLAFVLYIRRLLISVNEFNSAMFGLEKEAAQRKLIKTITVLALIGLLILAEFIIVIFLAPEYPQQPTFATETEVTPTLALITPGPVPTDATKTPTPYPQAVVEGEVSNCIEGILEFTDPVQGQEVKGVVELKGTVNIPSFGSYKYEYSSAESLDWITVAAGSEVKINQSIGYWYTTSLVPGNYILKLVALDNQGNEQTPCMINVTIVPGE